MKDSVDNYEILKNEWQKSIQEPVKNAVKEGCSINKTSVQHFIGDSVGFRLSSWSYFKAVTNSEDPIRKTYQSAAAFFQKETEISVLDNYYVTVNQGQLRNLAA